VVSMTLADDLQGQVEWRRVRAPTRPFALRFLCFYVLGGIALARSRSGLVHTIGAVVPNRVDLVTIQFSHVSFYRAWGRLAPPTTSRLRALARAVGRVLGIAAERWSLRPSRVSVLLAASRAQVTELERRFPGVRVMLVPNACDLERFRPNPELRAEMRKTLGVEPHEVVALFVGSDFERKGLRPTIEALPHIPADGARPHLWVVGAGDEARYQRLAQDLGVDEYVKFFGGRPDAERFFAAADIFVLPTLYETFCIAAYEAAAIGLPVVGTPVSGIDELVGDGRAGIAVTQDTSEIATALETLARNRPLRERLGVTGRERASFYTWSRAEQSALAGYEACWHGSASDERVPAAASS
jgi:glycosyltransferase involved in cell wall biosynthesis